MTTDPFGTAALRAAVLDTWARSPSRLREDSNAEEDHAGGYYRDRVVVELAQNAADAAAREGGTGHLLLHLVTDGDSHVLVAANTGAPLDRAGVVSLASLRASAKSADDAGLVGRFGVGFAAVRSVSDDVWLLSRSVGSSEAEGVRFDLGLTQDALTTLGEGAARLGGLADQVAARGHSLPVLRLPFSARLADLADDVGSHVVEAVRSALRSHTTAVVLRLRDAAAAEAVRQQLSQVDDSLLLALGALDEVTVALDDPALLDGSERTFAAVADRWTTVIRSGPVPADLLAARPVEERGRARWTLTWAVPRDRRSTTWQHVVHAPTPTDEPSSVPALLIASFPLDPSRRHIDDGPLADWLVARAGEAYADLVGLVDEPLALVPAGLPQGRFDASLRESVLAALRESPMLGGVRAGDAVMLDGDLSPELCDALRPSGLGVVAVPRRLRGAARLLGVEVMTLVDVLDSLPAGLAPSQWRDLYAAVEPAAEGDRSFREALSAIFVPLADGTTARGPRGLLLPSSGGTVDGALTAGALLGLRTIHPEAAHPALLRWGAVAADDPVVVGLDSVESAVRQVGDALVGSEVDGPPPAAPGGDDRDPWAVLDALLGLLVTVLDARQLRVGDLPLWWSSLPLPGDDGVWHEARELSWPGSWAAEHLDLPLVEQVDGLVPVSAEMALVLGVRAALAVVTVEWDSGSRDRPDVVGWAEYDDYLCSVLGEGVPLGEIVAVADLDVVLDDSWGDTVIALSSTPELRSALLGPVRGGGSSDPASALSYTAWFLRDLLGAPFAGPALSTVLPPVPDDLSGTGDPQVMRALGVLAAPQDVEDFLSAADADCWDSFFAALGDRTGHEHSVGSDDGGEVDDSPVVGAPVPIAVARALWSALETAAIAGLELDPLPELMVVLRGAVARTSASLDLAVSADPMWAQVREVVPVHARESEELVAHALDGRVLDSAQAVVHVGDAAAGLVRQVPPAVQVLVPGVPDSWEEHDELVVDGVEVDWWVTADSRVHVRSGAGIAAAAQGCAQVAGDWRARFLVEVVLGTPGRRDDVEAHSSWDQVAPRDRFL